MLKAVSGTLAARYDVAVNSTLLAGFSMLIYDHLLTFDNEIAYIWRKPKSVVSAIFVANRYIVPCTIAVEVYDKLAAKEHPAIFCRAWTLLRSYLTIFCYVSVHAVVAIRVNAIHNNESKVRRLLWLGGTFYALSTFIFMTAAFSRIFAHVNTQGECISEIPSYLWIVWMPTIVLETILFILAARFIISRFAGKRDIGAFYVTLFIDGAVYFIVAAACATFSLVVWAEAPPGLVTVARPLSLCLVTLSGSRLVLNLRQRIAEDPTRVRSVLDDKSQGPVVSGFDTRM
ncbi:hypothetical protein LshimejAT787_0904910 [Lyophyllum shimeji]|uniref:DUF6533 domain-containing protein n=1 Tax=Lyophyllum shimeji TaxID=47721 RepID=A0A9P3USK1_LYOSH|nr:hypothetical protein LshimejAT787_0904910 [Lyophyllum shimeji]